MFLFFALAIIFGFIIFRTNQNNLTVNFLDVGQGDSILISQGKKQILIDGGPSGQKMMEKLGTYVPFWDREIEVIVITHPDSDHIEGLVNVLQNYQVDAIIETDVSSESAVYAKLQDLIKEKNIQKIKGERGIKIKFSEKNELEILNSEDENAVAQKETNSSSLVSKLAVGDEKFLFMGDLPSEKESSLFGLDISANVLKIAHHGSKYSTSAEFLDKVNPQDTVISVGKNNRYGHPNLETLDRLKNKKINIFRTDVLGDIIYECQSFNNKCQRIF
jgi:competence protein ComEC